eukprot:13682465-Heterocapsa_arctica.AAC.1
MRRRRGGGEGEEVVAMCYTDDKFILCCAPVLLLSREVGKGGFYSKGGGHDQTGAGRRTIDVCGQDA